MTDNLDYKIPLNDYFKSMDLKDDKRRSRCKVIKSFDAIIKVGNIQYLSLTKYAACRLEHLDRIGKNALTSDKFHILELYADLSRDMLFEWILLTKIFIDSLTNSKNDLSIEKHKQLFDTILEQHISISKHNATANKLLFKLVFMTPKNYSPKNNKAGK